MSRLTVNLLTTASPSDVLTVVPGAAITIFARNADGTEGGVAPVYAFADPADSTLYAGLMISDSQGRIPGWLDPGDYVIAVAASGYSPYSAAYTVPRTVITQDPSGADMPFEPHIQFAGTDIAVADDPANTRTVITSTPTSGSALGVASTNDTFILADSETLVSAGSDAVVSLVLTSPPPWLDAFGNVLEPGVYGFGVWVHHSGPGCVASSVPGQYAAIAGGITHDLVPIDPLFTIFPGVGYSGYVSQVVTGVTAADIVGSVNTWNFVVSVPASATSAIVGARMFGWQIAA